MARQLMTMEQILSILLDTPDRRPARRCHSTMVTLVLLSMF